MKKLLVLCFVLVILVNCSQVSNALTTDLEFSDINKKGWYYKDLVKLYNRNIIDGFSDSTFKPTSTLTREQFIKILVTAVNPNKKYERVGDSWFTTYELDAYLMRIIDAKMTQKEYKEPITREEVVHLISNALKLGKYSLPDNYYQNNKDLIESKRSVIEGKILDFNKINKKYLNDIFDVYELGIVKGYVDSTFKPQGILTRAEATAVVSRFIDVREEDIENGDINFATIKNYVYSENGLVEMAKEKMTDIVGTVEKGEEYIIPDHENYDERTDESLDYEQYVDNVGDEEKAIDEDEDVKESQMPKLLDEDIYFYKLYNLTQQEIDYIKIYDKYYYKYIGKVAGQKSPTFVTTDMDDLLNNN